MWMVDVQIQLLRHSLNKLRKGLSGRNDQSFALYIPLGIELGAL
jgi:hypothetical protein